MTRTLLAVAAVAALGMTACSSDTKSTDATTVSVDSGNNTCTLSATSAPAGSVVFKVENTGDEATEFYVYAENGEDVVGEVENIGPGLTRDLSADLSAGSYVTACKPGMSGDGIRADFTAE